MTTAYTRWPADVDLKKDHYVQNLTMKIMFFICGGICLNTTVSALQIWAPEEDYDVMCNYIRERLEKRKDLFGR